MSWLQCLVDLGTFMEGGGEEPKVVGGVSTSGMNEEGWSQVLHSGHVIWLPLLKRYTPTPAVHLLQTKLGAISPVSWPFSICLIDVVISPPCNIKVHSIQICLLNADYGHKSSSNPAFSVFLSQFESSVHSCTPLQMQGPVM